MSTDKVGTRKNSANAPDEAPKCKAGRGMTRPKMQTKKKQQKTKKTFEPRKWPRKQKQEQHEDVELQKVESVEGDEEVLENAKQKVETIGA